MHHITRPCAPLHAFLTVVSAHRFERCWIDVQVRSIMGSAFPPAFFPLSCDHLLPRSQPRAICRSGVYPLTVPILPIYSILPLAVCSRCLRLWQICRIPCPLAVPVPGLMSHENEPFDERSPSYPSKDCNRISLQLQIMETDG